MEGGGGKGVHFLGLNVFFHCGEVKEGKGVIFCTNSWEGRGVG